MKNITSGDTSWNRYMMNVVRTAMFISPRATHVMPTPTTTASAPCVPTFIDGTSRAL